MKYLGSRAVFIHFTSGETEVLRGHTLARVTLPQFYQVLLIWMFPQQVPELVA